MSTMTTTVRLTQTRVAYSEWIKLRSLRSTWWTLGIFVVSTIGVDGRYAYPSTGDVVDVKARKIVMTLKDETGAEVQSEKLLEIDFRDGKAVRAGNQFGVGQVTR